MAPHHSSPLATDMKVEGDHLESRKIGENVFSDGDLARPYDQEEERRITKAILWKLDTRTLFMLAVLFLFSFLDRSVIILFTGTS